MRLSVTLPASIVVVLLATMLISPCYSAALEDDYPFESYSSAPPVVDISQTYPSSLDLRDQGLVTSIKNQEIYGTCWAFSAMSCIETCLINQGYADNTLDLSELHLAYFLNETSADPEGGLDGDFIDNGDYKMSGANTPYSTFALSTWKGIAMDSEFPYALIYEGDPGIDGHAYDSDAYVITDVLWINSKDDNAVKAVLNTGNAVSFSFYYSSEPEYTNIETFENTRTSSFYYDEFAPASNHEVSIIGYDDNYSADNFATTPPGDGAWLIKNSWGTNEASCGSDGCMWISYYTQGQDMRAAFYAVPEYVYDNNYQYDGGGSQHQNITYGNTGYMANVFAASGNERLEAISFYNMNNVDVDYEVQIYLNPTDTTDPISGKPMLDDTQTGNVMFAGYHTIELEDSVSLDEGDVFAIVIKLTDPEKDMYLAVDTSVNVYDPIDSAEIWGTCRTTAIAGQSLASGDGDTWDDISSDGMSNLRVKAFTVNDNENGTHDNTIMIVGLILIIVALAMIGAIFYFRRSAARP